MTLPLSPQTLAELRAIGDRVQADQEATAVKAIGDRLRDAEVASLYRAYRRDVLPVPDPAMGGRYVFAEVAAGTVGGEIRKAAECAITWSSIDNSLSYVPTLHWFVPETDADRSHVAHWGCRDWSYLTHPRAAKGFALRDSGEIWLDATLEARDAVRIALHETRHLAQRPGLGHLEAEEDAWAHADQLKGRVLAYLAS